MVSACTMSRRPFIPKQPHVFGASRMEQDMLFMATQMDDQFAAVNEPLATAQGEMRVQYLNHHPQLVIRTKHSPEEVFFQLDTRAKRLQAFKMKDEINQHLIMLLIERLQTIECTLGLNYDVEPQTKRKRVKLHLQSNNSQQVRHTLWWCYRGEKSPWFPQFEKE
jgi:hypothetical protein